MPADPIGENNLHRSCDKRRCWGQADSVAISLIAATETYPLSDLHAAITAHQKACRDGKIFLK